jgi:carbonic anhydrase/acetyltransferase-like protein (isoleucine patch superfamily)
LVARERKSIRHRAVQGDDLVGNPLILTLGELVPELADDVFVAPGAVIVGDVHLLPGSSVWYTSVLRGDGGRITLGEGSNLQDGCVVHADREFPTTIGARVTVGHRAMLHGATIEDDVLIGMGALLMNGCVIGSGSMVAAGALVSQGVVIPPNSLVVGVPGRVVGPVREIDTELILRAAGSYVALGRAHAEALAKAR